MLSVLATMDGQLADHQLGAPATLGSNQPTTRASGDANET
jgi:hypothetical protein